MNLDTLPRPRRPASGPGGHVRPGGKDSSPTTYRTADQTPTHEKLCARSSSRHGVQVALRRADHRALSRPGKRQRQPVSRRSRAPADRRPRWPGCPATPACPGISSQAPAATLLGHRSDRRSPAANPPDLTLPGIRPCPRSPRTPATDAGSRCCTAPRSGRPASISSSCVPSPMMAPSRSTMMRSASRTVDRRWAMTMAVRSLMSASSPSWICSSVKGSTLAVASSRMRMAGSFRTTRAKRHQLALPHGQAGAALADVGIQTARAGRPASRRG